MWVSVEIAAGTLLVATPQLLDPNFADSVVLILDTDDDGALGIVLNRPSAVAVADVLPGWRDTVSDPDVVFHGGPVSPEGALAVGLLRDPEVPPDGFRPVSGPLGIVDLDATSDDVPLRLEAMRIFAGYAGWGAGQLEGEVSEGSWYVVSSESGDPFRLDPSDLWRDVLRRQPGQLAWHTTRPLDPELN